MIEKSRFYVNLVSLISASHKNLKIGRRVASRGRPPAVPRRSRNGSRCRRIKMFQGHEPPPLRSTVGLTRRLDELATRSYRYNFTSRERPQWTDVFAPASSPVVTSYSSLARKHESSGSRSPLASSAGRSPYSRGDACPCKSVPIVNRDKFQL